MNRHLLTVLFFVVAWLLVADSWAADQLPFEQRQNVVYGETHGTGLLMDVFTPVGDANGLAIIDVVSGAWYSDRGKIRDHMLAQVFSIFCSRGYVVFGVRPGSRTRYTAAEMDQHVKTAIRYVKHHASEYQIDAQRLGIMGASAGGHLATLAALTPVPGDPQAKDPLGEHDTSLRAAAAFFPPTDFLDWKDGKPIDATILRPLLFLGAKDGESIANMESAARSVSPFHQVGKTTVPFLLIHGDADPLVPLSQSQKLVDAIQKSGGSAELIVKPGGGHPWLTLPVEVNVMADWFDRQLAKKENSHD